MNANLLMKTRLIILFLAPLATLFYAGTMHGAESLGRFEDQSEVGKPSKAGAVVFDAAAQVYEVAVAAPTCGPPTMISTLSGSG